MLRALFIFIITYSSLHAEKVNGLTLEAPPQPFTEEQFSRIDSIHPNWVAIVPYAFVRKGGNEVVYSKKQSHWWGEGLEGVEAQIQAARKQGLKVMLKPQIWRAGGVYTGELRFHSEADWKQFEDSYSNYILGFAESDICKSADAVCIGTELDSSVRERAQFWKHFATKCRNLFPGKLTYAANWNVVHEVTFWNQLDAVGANAYFPIDIKAPKTSWQPHIDYLKKIHLSTGKPVIFPEYGYRSVDNTTVEPWAAEGNRSSNLDAQKQALDIFYQEIWQQEWCHGGFLWKWKLRAQGENDPRGYTVQNKPAAEVVEKYYKNSD